MNAYCETCGKWVTPDPYAAKSGRLGHYLTHAEGGPFLCGPLVVRTPAEEHDEKILVVIMNEDTLTEEQLRSGDRLILLENCDTWRAHKQDFEWDGMRNVWVLIEDMWS